MIIVTLFTKSFVLKIVSVHTKRKAEISNSSGLNNVSDKLHFRYELV